MKNRTLEPLKTVSLISNIFFYLMIQIVLFISNFVTIQQVPKQLTYFQTLHGYSVSAVHVFFTSATRSTLLYRCNGATILNSTQFYSRTFLAFSFTERAKSMPTTFLCNDCILILKDYMNSLVFVVSISIQYNVNETTKLAVILIKFPFPWLYLKKRSANIQHISEYSHLMNVSITYTENVYKKS